ncbi:hypothetical protein E2562_013868 [Oryza meyeriana var. granulata]|uniref:Uncharacterized protein n=1 Tax=Oryza meyeriana var. granulata TaxID=110450 RepID=A0A6G1C7J1_9ORYZ|nr:hypothetical protein E2562_013868 [Oryza meyeriana var. granulata]
MEGGMMPDLCRPIPVGRLMGDMLHKGHRQLGLCHALYRGLQPVVAHVHWSLLVTMDKTTEEATPRTLVTQLVASLSIVFMGQSASR